MSAELQGSAPSRTEAVYAALRQSIGAGEYAVGQRLPSEARLCDAFDVSRVVIREALSRLRADGLVVSRHGSGSYVRQAASREFLPMLPIADVDDLLRWQELRIAIEVETSFLAAQRRSDDDVRELDRIVERMRADENWRNMRALDFAFHRAVAASTGNALLVNAIDSLNSHMRSWIDVVTKVSESRPQQRQTVRVEEHAAVVQAIRARDPETARQVMRLHIENGRTRLLSALARLKHDRRNATDTGGGPPA